MRYVELFIEKRKDRSKINIASFQICYKFNNPEAKRRAIANVEKFFPVVGVTENVDMTLKVLEKVLPEYFTGATETYYNEEYVVKNQNRNKHKKPVSKETLQIIRQNFTNEIEFYEFCKVRLKNQYDLLFSNT